jgi:magnesium transporter
VSATVTVRWCADGLCSEGGLDDLATARSAGLVWIDVLAPDEATMGRLAEVFSLHPLAVEDTLHSPQRPKLDSFGPHLLLTWNVVSRSDGDGLVFCEIDSILGDGFLITAHDEPVVAIDDVAKSVQRYLPRGPEWTLHAILDGAVDDAFPIVDYVSEELDQLEDAFLTGAGREELPRLYALKRMLVSLHRTLAQERDIMRQLTRHESLISEDAYLYFQDVGDHLARAADAVDTYRDVASGAMDIYLSSVNNRMNEIMKQLTVVATIFMPLTLLSGIYGMNVVRGMWPPITEVWSFPAVIGSMVVIAVGMLWFFKRRNWW